MPNPNDKCSVDDNDDDDDDDGSINSIDLGKAISADSGEYYNEGECSFVDLYAVIEGRARPKPTKSSLVSVSETRTKDTNSGRGRREEDGIERHRRSRTGSPSEEGRERVSRSLLRSQSPNGPIRRTQTERDASKQGRDRERDSSLNPRSRSRHENTRSGSPKPRNSSSHSSSSNSEKSRSLSPKPQKTTFPVESNSEKSRSLSPKPQKSTFSTDSNSEKSRSLSPKPQKSTISASSNKGSSSATPCDKELQFSLERSGPGRSPRTARQCQESDIYLQHTSQSHPGPLRAPHAPPHPLSSPSATTRKSRTVEPLSQSNRHHHIESLERRHDPQGERSIGNLEHDVETIQRSGRQNRSTTHDVPCSPSGSRRHRSFNADEFHTGSFNDRRREHIGHNSASAASLEYDGDVPTSNGGHHVHRRVPSSHDFQSPPSSLRRHRSLDADEIPTSSHHDRREQQLPSTRAQRGHDQQGHFSNSNSENDHFMDHDRTGRNSSGQGRMEVLRSTDETTSASRRDTNGAGRSSGHRPAPDNRRTLERDSGRARSQSPMREVPWGLTNDQDNPLRLLNKSPRSPQLSPVGGRKASSTVAAYLMSSPTRKLSSSKSGSNDIPTDEDDKDAKEKKRKEKSRRKYLDNLFK